MEDWFSPRSATRAVARLEPVVDGLCRVWRYLERRRPARPAERAVPPDYFELLLRFRRARGRLERAGARLADPRRGRVLLTARRAGRPVWLCWQAGDAAPHSWHERGEGWSSRRPIDADGPWEEPPRAR